jgi:hypothetical protein
MNWALVVGGNESAGCCVHTFISLLPEIQDVPKLHTLKNPKVDSFDWSTLQVFSSFGSLVGYINLGLVLFLVLKNPWLICGRPAANTIVVPMPPPLPQ